jgi:pseudouridine synthase
VVDLINLPQRLFPVGRLDQDTEGLLLLTNDGELAHALTHPSFEVERVYVALVPGPVRKQTSSPRSAPGVELEDGLARPKRARVLEEERSKALLEIVMTEGRKREVRRMLGGHGLTVERLARVAYGGVELGDLRQGKWRFLTHEEVGALHAAVAGGDAARRGGATGGRRTDSAAGPGPARGDHPGRRRARAPARTHPGADRRHVRAQRSRRGRPGLDRVHRDRRRAQRLPGRGGPEAGITHVPLLCARELDIDGGIERCIRLLVHAYTSGGGRELRHVYLHDARQLRTDLPE